MIYIAAPFFSDEQLNAVKSVELILDLYGLKYFSPRLHGIDMSKLSEEERKSGQTAKKVFQNNVENMNNCDFMMACSDWKDQGTNFEMGYFYATTTIHIENYYSGERCKNLITWSAIGKPSNLMISQCTAGHCKSLDELKEFVRYVDGHGPKEPNYVEWMYLTKNYPDFSRLDVDERIV